VPHGRPIPIWDYWGDPAMPIKGRYTDNDSWSTNELDIDWQGVTLYRSTWRDGGPAVHRRRVRP
jgi:hypothetical protein